MTRYILFILVALCCPVASTLAADSDDKIFGRPFSGEFPLGNWHDHNVPREFIDSNGFIVNSEGQQCNDTIDGHEGYDWLMPEGTPLLAVADGTISYAGDETPFVCPILGNSTVSGVFVRLSTVRQGETLLVDYAHISQLAVTSGQTVKKGDLIGYSGNTGCSTTPHLHFVVYRSVTNGEPFSAIDPYGWNGSGTDPWTTNSLGATSIYLWGKNVAPTRYFLDAVAANDCNGCGSSVAITKVRWMGPNDSKTPNNEFIELTVDPRFGPSRVNLNGFKLKNNKGKTFRIQTTSATNARTPLAIYTGKGRNSKKRIYLGQKKGIWNDMGDCVRLMTKQNRLMYYFFVGNARCPNL